MFLVSCSGGSTSSGGGQDPVLPLTTKDKEALSLAGGFQSKWLKGSKEVQRWNISVGGAYPDGLIVLGNDTLNQPVTWIAGIMVHEACHHRRGRVCSTEEETRCIIEQIEFDQTVGGSHVQRLRRRSLIGIHTCP